MNFLTCPVCRGEMRETIREGVTIDTCSQCRGVWLDRGELEKLAATFGNPPPPTSPEQGQASGAGFWRQPSAPPAQAMPPPNYRDAGHQPRRGWGDDDDDDDDRRKYRESDNRQHGPQQKSKLGRLMDFFD